MIKLTCKTPDKAIDMNIKPLLLLKWIAYIIFFKITIFLSLGLLFQTVNSLCLWLITRL